MKRWLVTSLMLGLIGSLALPVLAENRARKRGMGGDSREAAARGQAAMATLMRRFDANKNGRLDQDEMKSFLAAADTNLDGRVSAEELMAVARGGEGKERPKEGAGKKKKNKE